MSDSATALSFSSTGVIIIVIAVLLAGWDVYLYAAKKKTISSVIRDLSWYHPVWPFIAGFLCGHWFG